MMFASMTTGLATCAWPDALWEKYYSWTPYQYSMNNPVNAYDENGKWVRGVHKDIINAAIVNLEAKGYSFSNEQKAALIDGMDRVDNDQVNQFKHVMLNPDETIQEQQVELDKWKAGQEKLFMDNDDWSALGESLHPTEDSFS